ncbi:DUF7680 family protein (plasmid) [Haloplanus ruber]|uniref:DUF7680 domain-containing protein n=1 Tax=Haloplanus ruber TaxID=869892 RepID=A0ABD6D565_9EURY|nr:hypothetical protein [Haloplanus ruber]
MASRDSEFGSPSAEDPDEDRLVRYGTSMFGGRPTFTLVRRETDGGAEWTLHELLPREQAEARRDRLERDGRSLSLTPVENLISDVAGDDLLSKLDGWTWDEWVGAKVARLDPTRVRALQDVVREAIEETPAETSEVLHGGEGFVFLPESAGIRLAVAFRGVKPLQRIDRMRSLARGVARMSDEECYYWYAKCRSPSSPNGEKALRVLLTNHIE